MITDLNKFLAVWRHIVDEIVVHTNDGNKHVFNKDGVLVKRAKA